MHLRDLGKVLLAALIAVFVVNFVVGILRDAIDYNTALVSLCSLLGVVYGIYSKSRDNGDKKDGGEGG